MRRSFLRLVLACAVLLAGVPRAAHAQDWSRYAEAANVITFRDTALYLDFAQLERVRRGLERSRAAFPELRRIVARGPGATPAPPWRRCCTSFPTACGSPWSGGQRRRGPRRARTAGW